MDTDNASLLTNAAALLEQSRREVQDLEAEIEGLRCQTEVLRARREVLNEVITSLSGKPRARRGRPAKQPEQQDDTAAIDAFADAVA